MKSSATYTITQNCWAVMQMYESPIDFITQGAQLVVENGIYKAIEHYNVNVNKEELLKALQYDRNQYNKGFKDGIDSVLERIRHLDFELVDGVVSFNYHDLNEVLSGKDYSLEVTF